MNLLRALTFLLLITSQIAIADQPNLDNTLVRNFLAEKQDREMNQVLSNSERKIAKTKLERIVSTIRDSEQGRILGIKRNADGYLVRVIRDGRIRTIQVNPDGGSVIR